MNPIAKLRLLAFKQQRGLCFYCCSPMWEGDPVAFAHKWGIRNERHIAWFRATAEHLIASRNGGPDEATNIVAACHYCNAQRHAGRRNPEATRYLRSVQMRCKQGKYPTRQLINRKQTANGRLHPRVA